MGDSSPYYLCNGKSNRPCQVQFVTRELTVIQQEKSTISLQELPIVTPIYQKAVKKYRSPGKQLNFQVIFCGTWSNASNECAYCLRRYFLKMSTYPPPPISDADWRLSENLEFQEGERF